MTEDEGDDDDDGEGGDEDQRDMKSHLLRLEEYQAWLDAKARKDFEARFAGLTGADSRRPAGFFRLAKSVC